MTTLSSTTGPSALLNVRGSRRRSGLCPGLTAIVVATALLAVGARHGEERAIALQFVPQETTTADAAILADGMSARPVVLKFEDSRPAAEVSIVGEGTEDDDSLFSWKPSTPVAQFAKQVFQRTAEGWGVRFEDGADLTLTVRLTRFFVAEKDQAVGSNYTADVRASFELRRADGAAISSGVASGDARRYGRKRSPDNCNEVLSDAMKECYAALFNHAGLQTAWSGKQPLPPAADAAIAPGALLGELLELKREGFSAALLIKYINRKALSSPLTAADLLEWKKGGLEESVIQAAMDRAPAEE